MALSTDTESSADASGPDSMYIQTIGALRQANRTLRQENRTLRQENRTLRQEGGKLLQENRHLLDHGADLENRVVKLQEELDDRDEHIKSISSNIKDRSMSRAEFENLSENLERTRRLLEAKIKVAEDNVTYAKACVSQREATKALNRDLESGLRRSKENIIELKDENGKLKRHNVVIQGEYEKVQRDLEIRNKENKTLSEDQKRTGARLDAMDRTAREREEEALQHDFRRDSLWDDEREGSAMGQVATFETLEDQLASLDVEPAVDVEEARALEPALDGSSADDLVPDANSAGGPISDSSVTETALPSETSALEQPKTTSPSKRPSNTTVKSPFGFENTSPTPNQQFIPALKSVDHEGAGIKKRASRKASRGSTSSLDQTSDSDDNPNICSLLGNSEPEDSPKSLHHGFELGRVEGDEEHQVSTQSRNPDCDDKLHAPLTGPEASLSQHPPPFSSSLASATDPSNSPTPGIHPPISGPSKSQQPSSSTLCSNSFHHLVPWVPLAHMVLCSFFLTWSAVSLQWERKMWEEANVLVLDWVHEAGWTGFSGWAVPWWEVLSFDLLLWSGALGELGVGM